ncbi:MAG: DinB family protein [Bacteroidetes bacterium]|nr:MAG: DinB family protein [Bacteroidota bacterium]
MNFNLKESIQILTRTPEVIEILLTGLPNEWIHNNEGPDTWSPFDIVGHLIHGEKTDWIPRAEIILSDKEDKTFVPFDRFAQFENSKGKTLGQLLTEFKEIRQENIKALEAMQIDDVKLEKTGIHPDFGEVTLKQLLATWTVHDLSHIHQMTRVLGKNYRTEAGPWRAFISILQ